MSEPHERDWQRLTDELRAYRNERIQAWGGLDDFTIAKYVAGECSDAEKTRVESVMAEKEAVRETVEILRETMSTAGLIPLASARTVSTALPAGQVWKTAQDGVSCLAERLRAWIDDTGRSLTEGLESLASRPKLVQSAMKEKLIDAGCKWELPVGDGNYVISLTLRPDPSTENWLLHFAPVRRSGESLLEATRVEILSAAGKRFFKGDLAMFNQQISHLSPGEWQLLLNVGGDVRRIDLELAPRRSAADE